MHKQIEYEIRPFTFQDREHIINNVNRAIAQGALLLVEQFTLTKDWSVCFSLQSCYTHLLLVAFFSGRVIGHCRFFPIGDDTNIGELGFVVHKLHRNRGVGTALIAQTLQLAKQNSYKIAILKTAVSNKPVITLANKFGFFEKSKNENQYHIRGNNVDEIVMTKLLDRNFSIAIDNSNNISIS